MNADSYKKISNIVVEKLSSISFEEENRLHLLDNITYRRFHINQTGYMICLLFDGNRTIREIVELIADEYDIKSSIIEEDILKFFNFLNRNNLILYKPSIKYYYFKLYKIIARIR